MFKKIFSKLSLFRRVHYILMQKAALDITKTMFCSIIDYGNIFISSCTDGDLFHVKILQNHALRCCCNVKSYTEVHVRDPHVDTNVQLVDIRQKKQILTCIWRNINKGIITTAIPLRETRFNVAPTIIISTCA